MQPDPPPSPLPARRLADGLPHALGLLVVALLLALLVALSIWQARTRGHERAAAAAQNLARLLEARVADALAQADLLLQAAAVLARDADGRSADGRGAVVPGLQALAAAWPDLQDLRLADADGRWRWRVGPAPAGTPPGRPPAAPAGLAAQHANPTSDSEEFQRALAPAAPGLIITGPRRQAADGPWRLVLSRALRAADGRFGGLVSVDLPLARFDALLGAIDLGEHGSAVLRSESLALVYRWTGAGAGAGAGADAGAGLAADDAAVGSTAVPAALREAMVLNPLAGEVDLPAGPDGIARISAYRQVLAYPLVLGVDGPGPDLAAGWGAVPLAIGALALATLAVVTLGTGLLYRSSQRALDAAQRQWAALVGASSDAILVETLDGVLTHWNPAAERLFGHSAAQMVGQSVQRLVPPEHRDQLALAVAQIARGAAVAPFETERLCRDGRRISVLISVAPVTAPDGRVVGSTRTARDITQHKAMRAELQQLALHDPLTRLPNRRLLLDRLGRAQQTSKRQGAYAALLVLELDLEPGGSTPPAGRPGLPAEHGPQLQLAQRLAASVRETDTVAGLDGRAFAVVCDNLGADALLAGRRLDALEAKLRGAVAQPMPSGAGPDGEPVVGGLRIGRRLFIGTDDAPAALIADADRAVPRPAPAACAPQDDVNEDEDDC